MSRRSNTQQQAETARAELTKRESDLRSLEAQAAEAKAAFEAEPSGERHSAAVCAQQLASNAAKGLAAYRDEVKPVLDAERLEQDRVNLRKLLGELHFEEDATKASDRVVAAFHELTAALGGLFALQGKAAEHGQKLRVIG
jgi:hypothetical protein